MGGAAPRPHTPWQGLLGRQVSSPGHGRYHCLPMDRPCDPPIRPNGRDTTRPRVFWPLAALVLVGAWAAMGWMGSVRTHPVEMVALFLVACLSWALACRGVLSGTQRPPVPWILAIALLCRLAALPGEASDDMARYRWEGLVQLAGDDPYRQPPDDPSLIPLAAQFADHGDINHPDWPAIYPPGMQLWQRAVASISPTPLAFKLSFLLAEALLFAALLAWLKHRSLPPERLLLFAWSPLSVYATALEGHHDVVAAAALVACLLALETRRPTLAALWFCAALLTKGFALAALPALVLRGRASLGQPEPSHGAVIPPRSWLAGLALIALVSAPFLAFVPNTGPLPSVLRFGSDLHYNDSVHDLIARVVGSDASRPLAALAWIAGAAWVLRRSPPDTARRVALLLAGLLLVLPTMHPWYLMALLPLLCLFPWWGWLALGASVCLTWLPHLEISATGRWVEWHEVKLPEYAPLFAWLAWRLFKALRPTPTAPPQKRSLTQNP